MPLVLFKNVHLYEDQHLNDFSFTQLIGMLKIVNFGVRGTTRPTFYEISYAKVDVITVAMMETKLSLSSVVETNHQHPNNVSVICAPCYKNHEKSRCNRHCIKNVCEK